MKRLLSLSLSLLLFASFSVTAFAHSGRTDGSGGHYDYNVGEYHYHHGYAAHQHTDLDGDGDLDCPYDFDDKTSHNPSYSSAASTSHSSNSARQVVVYTPQPKITPNKETSVKEEPTVFQSVCFYVLICVSIALYTALRWERKSNQAEEEKLRGQIKTERLKTKNILDHLYSGKDLLKISGAPEKCWIGSDGRPYSAGEGMWGDRYTFYINPHGHSYHKKECRFSGPSMINAMDLRWQNNYAPCAVCKPVLPDLQWYDECLRIDRLMREYGIEKQE